MRLENLIKIFADNSCTELKDRIYGLLGLANDVSLVTGADNGLNPLEKDVKEMDNQLNNISDHRRKSGSFRVDYARSFYGIWSDVVHFAYFRAKIVKHPLENGEFWEQERHISIVRTAGIIQEALGQKSGGRNGC